MEPVFTTNGFAHYRSICIPSRKNGVYPGMLAYDWCRDAGVGIFQISSPKPDFKGDIQNGEIGQVRVGLNPRLYRHVRRDWSNVLCDEQKTYAVAGNADNEYYSPFKGTVSAVKKYLKDHPGATMKEVIDNVETHYTSSATARSSLMQWINKGIIKGIRMDESKRPYRLYLVQEAR